MLVLWFDNLEFPMLIYNILQCQITLPNHCLCKLQLPNDSHMFFGNKSRCFFILFSSLHRRSLEILFKFDPFRHSSACALGALKRVRPRPQRSEQRGLTMCVVSQRAELGDVCVETLLKDREMIQMIQMDHWTIMDHPTFRRNETSMWCKDVMSQLIDLIDAKWCCFMLFPLPPKNYIPEHVCSF